MIEADHGAFISIELYSSPRGRGDLSVKFMSQVLVPEELVAVDSKASRLATCCTSRLEPFVALGYKLRHLSSNNRSIRGLHTLDRSTMLEPNCSHRHDGRDDDDDDSRLRSPKHLPTSCRRCTFPSRTFSKRNSSPLLLMKNRRWDCQPWAIPFIGSVEKQFTCLSSSCAVK